MGSGQHREENIKKKQDGVWIETGPVVVWAQDAIDFVLREAPLTEKRRARICAHQEGDRMHQMLIALCVGTVLDEHSHDRPESMLVLRGTLLIHLTDLIAGVQEREIYLEAGSFLRIPAGMAHRPVPITDCVILECAEK